MIQCVGDILLLYFKVIISTGAVQHGNWNDLSNKAVRLESTLLERGSLIFGGSLQYNPSQL